MIFAKWVVHKAVTVSCALMILAYMEIELTELYEQRLAEIAERLGCDSDTAIRRCIDLTTVVTWELSHEGTTVVFDAPEPRGKAILSHHELYAQH